MKKIFISLYLFLIAFSSLQTSYGIPINDKHFKDMVFSIDNTWTIRLLYVPTDTGLVNYIIMKDEWNEFDGKYFVDTTYVYRKGIPINNFVMNYYNIGSLATTENEGDSCLLIDLANDESDEYKDYTPYFVAPGSKVKINKIRGYYNDLYKRTMSESLANDVFICCSGDVNGLYYSPDYTKNWKQVFNLPINNFECCYYKGKKSVLLSYSDSLGCSRILRSSDNGTSWDEIYSKENIKIIGLKECNDAMIYVSGDNFSALSVDGGNTWIENDSVPISNIAFDSGDTEIYGWNYEKSNELKLWYCELGTLEWKELISIPCENDAISDVLNSTFQYIYTDFGKLYMVKNGEIFMEYPVTTDIPIIQMIENSIKSIKGNVIIDLPTEIINWSAALYNSSGIKVAHKSGSGNEIILPTTSKGTHILAIKADGKLIKKKVLVK